MLKAIYNPAYIVFSVALGGFAKAGNSAAQLQEHVRSQSELALFFDDLERRVESLEMLQADLWQKSHGFPLLSDLKPLRMGRH